MRRSIRLKEWGGNQNLVKVPAEEYLSLRPNLEKKEYLLNTDSQGFIVSKECPKNLDQSVFFLGDSFVESMFVSEGKRFTDLCETYFNEKFGFSCRNAGYSGATSLHLFNSFLNKIVPFKPKILFFILPSNDALSLANKNLYWTNSKTLSPIIPQQFGVENAPILNNRESIRAMIRSIHETCVSFRINVVFCTFPHRTTVFGDSFTRKTYKSKSNFNSYVERRKIANDILRGYCARRNAPFIDLELIMEDFEAYSVDDVHLDENGSQKVSQIILSWCEKNEKSLF